MREDFTKDDVDLRSGFAETTAMRQHGGGGILARHPNRVRGACQQSSTRSAAPQAPRGRAGRGRRGRGIARHGLLFHRTFQHNPPLPTTSACLSLRSCTKLHATSTLKPSLPRSLHHKSTTMHRSSAKLEHLQRNFTKLVRELDCHEPRRKNTG